MTWAEKVRFKLRTVHTEMAELRRYIHERGLPEAEAEHLFRGHLRSLDALALDKLPLAVAMDTSDILVRYQGKDAHAGRCPVTKMNRLFTTLRQQVVEMTKSHGQLSGSRFRWTGDVDLLVTACTPNLIFGFKLPEQGVRARDEDNRMLLDPHYTALKDSLEFMGVVASSLQQENPRVVIDEFAASRGPNVDECFIDSGLVAARKLLPARDKKLESVEIAGRVVSGEGYVIDRERWDRADHIIRANHIPRDTLELTGFLMVVDYEVGRFTLRRLDDGWKVRGVRCRYREEHEEFVRSHGKKKIWVKGRACFDRERQPRFVEVDDLRAA